MSEKIIVIDDEPLILSSIERALSKIGYEVTATGSLEEFQKAIRSVKFDLVIMDLHMEGVNTGDLAAEAKRIMPSARFLTISGSVPAVDSDHFLQKPFRIDALRERVREILNEPS